MGRLPVPLKKEIPWVAQFWAGWWGIPDQAVAM